jgi:uncharacterized protein (UPF0548 family)
MWSFTLPSDARVHAFLAEQAKLGFSYPHVGATAAELTPPGYDFDHNRAQLGLGQVVFEAACEALRRWRHFPAPLAFAEPADTPLAAGNVVAVLARAFGVWWLNAARIVYVVEETGTPRRFGFAYGTLPGHVEEGEERFLVEWHADDTVWYDLRAFSKPRHPLVKLGYPLARRMQRRFARESLAAMRRASS